MGGGTDVAIETSDVVLMNSISPSTPRIRSSKATAKHDTKHFYCSGSGISIISKPTI